MTEGSLIDLVLKKARQKGMKTLTRAEAGHVLNALRETMREELAQGGTVWLRPLGCFRVRQRAARPGRNLRTGEVVTIGERRRIVFLPSLNLKKAVGKHVSRT